MRKTNYAVLAMLVASLLIVAVAWAKGDYTKKESVEQQITALTDQLNQAFGKGDTGWMEKHFADDFTAIHSNGKLSNKAEEIDNVKTNNLKWATVDTHDRKIHVYGDTAVVVTLASSTGTVGGNPYSGDFRTTLVFVRQNGNWKMVAFQSTRVPSASQ